METVKEYDNLLIENQDFSIYGDNDLQSIRDDLLTLLSNKKRSLLSFFHLQNYSKIKVVLCKNPDVYNEYRTLTENEDIILICYNKIMNSKENSIFLFLRFSILNAFIKKLLSSLYRGHFERPLWLEEGLAFNLSGEKLNIEKSDFSFRNYYLENIVRRDKKLPNVTFFEKNSKREWLEYSNFDPYELSYLLVHYLLETHQDIYEIIKDFDKIKEIEKTILTDCIAYYNEKYPVVTSFSAIKNDRELMDFMTKNILYGWIDKDKKATENSIKNSFQLSRTASIEDILKTQVGTCVDQAKLIHHWFKSVGIESKLFCVRSYTIEDGKKKIIMHSFVLFHYQECWYHFEQTMTSIRGVYPYSTLEEAILETAKKCLRGYLEKEITEVPFIPSGLTYQELQGYISSFPKYEEVCRER